MVTPAMQLASKIPDAHVQLWASSILKGKVMAPDYLSFKLAVPLNHLAVKW